MRARPYRGPRTRIRGYAEDPAHIHVQQMCDGMNQVYPQVSRHFPDEQDR